MGTSINCEEMDKLCKKDAPVFYKALEDLNINFLYYNFENPDYDCPYIPHESLKRIIDSGKLETEDGILLQQVTEIFEKQEDLQLIH